MKIAVRVPNWVGDIIFCTPTLASIKENFPQAEVWLVAREKNRELCSQFEFVDGIIPLPQRNKREKLWESVKRINAHKFDTGILLTCSFSSSILFLLANIPQRWGYSRHKRGMLITKRVAMPSRDNPVHQVEFYLNLISSLGLKTREPQLVFSVSDGEKERAQHTLTALEYDPRRPLVIMSPGSFSGQSKRWPASRFSRLASLLQDGHGAKIVIQGAAGEECLAEEVASHMRNKPSLLTGLSLPQLAALTSFASLFIANDSGPLHLANALRVPVVGIYGPTDPRVTRPFHQPSAVVKKDVSCSPCKYRVCPIDHRCLEEISPEEVYRVCQQFLS